MMLRKLYNIEILRKFVENFRNTKIREKKFYIDVWSAGYDTIERPEFEAGPPMLDGFHDLAQI